MKPIGARGQNVQDFLYCADGTIAQTNVSQLVLPRAKSRSYLFIQNLSSNVMNVEIGSARATAAISGGAVTSFTISNGGFGYIKPPLVLCLGGGPVEGNSGAGLGATLPDWPAPSRPATGLAAINGSGVVTGITLSDPGAGYLRAPYVQLISQSEDALGVADPYFSTTRGGYQLAQNATIEFQFQCPTDAVAIVGTANDLFVCRWMY